MTWIGHVQTVDLSAQQAYESNGTPVHTPSAASDQGFLLDSPIGALSVKQREILTTASGMMNSVVPGARSLDECENSGEDKKFTEAARKLEAKMQATIKAKEAAEEKTHIKVRIGQKIGPDQQFPGGRYRINKLLGKGVYGKVFECVDEKYAGALVAVKIVRNEPLFTQAAMNEIRVLRKLDGNCGLLRMCRNFSYMNHVCISCDLYGETLSQKLQRVGSLSLAQVADVGLQLLHGVNHMRNCGIVHTDLKTENVLVYHRYDSACDDGDDVRTPLCVRIVDLGSAVFEESWHQQHIGTNEYRAPEAILHTGWSYHVDVWAIGCILVELFLGKKLFGEQLTDNAHLLLMETCLERKIPKEMLQKSWSMGATKTSRVLINHKGVCINPKMGDVLQESKIRQASVLRQDIMNDELLDLLDKLLVFDPAKRAAPGPLRKHAFFVRARFDTSDIDIKTAYPPLNPPIDDGSEVEGSKFIIVQEEHGLWRNNEDVTEASMPERTLSSKSCPPDRNITPPSSIKMEPRPEKAEPDVSPMMQAHPVSVPPLTRAQPAPEQPKQFWSQVVFGHDLEHSKENLDFMENRIHPKSNGEMGPVSRPVVYSRILSDAEDHIDRLSSYLQRTRTHLEETEARIARRQETFSRSQHYYDSLAVVRTPSYLARESYVGGHPDGYIAKQPDHYIASEGCDMNLAPPTSVVLAPPTSVFSSRPASVQHGQQAIVRPSRQPDDGYTVLQTRSTIGYDKTIWM